MREAMLRLPQILSFLALILVSGVVSVHHLEQASGGANVPGLVVVEAPWMGPASLERLRREWPEAVVERVPAGDDLLAPFDVDFLGRVVERGDAARLYSLNEGVDLALGRSMGWPEVLDEITPMGRESELEAMAREAARFVRTRTDPQAFLVGLLGGPEPSGDMIEVVRAFAEGAEHLPWFRRTSVVVLGASAPLDAEGDLPTRWAWRLDLGRWVGRARPALADLVESRW